MSYSKNELFRIADEIKKVIDASEEKGLGEIYSKLENATNLIGKSFSGSWLGYHSSVYYRQFTPPPAGARFDKQWGLTDQNFREYTTGNWVEYDSASVMEKIYEVAGNPDIEEYKRESSKARELFQDKKEEYLSTVMSYLQGKSDVYVEKQKEKVEELNVLNQSDFVEYFTPKGKFYTNDSTAANQGIRVPPHMSVLSEILGLKHPYECLKKLEKNTRRTASHLAKLERDNKKSQEVGTKVFIGHGHSLEWKIFKDFIQDSLKLPWDEFNRIPVAGRTNISRLSQMLEDAAIAFIIMTAEDEQLDGNKRARMNVIHEVGLFQGKLGFSKAIILLEEGCEEFSNIEGLGQIRFPKNNIKAVFEEVREILRREDII